MRRLQLEMVHGLSKVTEKSRISTCAVVGVLHYPYPPDGSSLHCLLHCFDEADYGTKLEILNMSVIQL